MTREECKEYQKAYYQAHKEQRIAQVKAWRAANKKHYKTYQKAWHKANKDRDNTLSKAYHQSDVNTLGQTKNSIRTKSRYYLSKHGIKIPGYEIHHCFTYDDPSKFIYCSKETHLKIHQFLRDNNIDASSDHYEQIKHLLDENVVIFGA